MIPTERMIATAMSASPNTPREEVIKILTAANKMPANLPPFPWNIRESSSSGRKPVVFINLEGQDGEEVCSWIVDAGPEVENRRERARFFMQAAEAFMSK